MSIDSVLVCCSNYLVMTILLLIIITSGRFLIETLIRIFKIFKRKRKR